MRQFVACKFAQGDKRTYTYHNDGEPVAVGDQVRVPMGQGQRIVTVAEIAKNAPPFETKAILGREGPKPGNLL